MGATGATVSAEAADAVIVIDRLDRLAVALHISRRALRIARQSVLAGMGVSLAAMAAAFAGPPAPRDGCRTIRPSRAGCSRPSPRYTRPRG